MVNVACIYENQGAGLIRTNPMKFDPNYIKEHLKSLEHFHRLAFCASCCERLLPNYSKFIDVENWGDRAFFRSTLDEIWLIISGIEIPVDSVRLMLQKCSDVTPDSKDFNSIYVSFAIDAGSAIYETLMYYLDKDIQHIVNVAGSSRDTVDMYIQERDNMDYNDPELEQKIAHDPLMIQEIKRQVDDLSILKG